MKNKKIRVALWAIAFVVAFVYLYLSIQYYYSLHPERQFNSQLKDFQLMKDYELNMSVWKNDTTTLYYGMPTIMVDTDHVYSPELSLNAKETSEIRQCRLAIVKTNLRSDDQKEIRIAIQIDDASGKTIFWADTPAVEIGKQWTSKVYLFKVDPVKANAAGCLKFYMINTRKSRFNIGTFNALLFRKETE